MAYEKVLFVYTTILKEGMAATGFYPPDAVLYDLEKGIHSIVVTSGFISDSAKVYWNEIDIIFEGKSVIEPAYDGESTFNILGSGSPNAAHYSSVASFFLKGVNLSFSGLYTAKVSLYDSDERGDKGHLLDEKESHFIVAGEFI